MVEPVHILITGGTGQVGMELARTAWPKEAVLHLPTRAQLDLSDVASVRESFERTPFSAVINAGAYTAVDKAETDVASAFAANSIGPAILGEITGKAGIPLIQVSTDYVFDGSKSSAYVEEDAVGPLGVYGASKLAGELAVLSANSRSTVVRTAWVLSPHGNNFLKTMLRLASDRPVLRVVGDQLGCPTSARDIAMVLKTISLRMIADRDAPTGVYHFVGSGHTTWAGLAEQILSLSAAAGGPFAAVEAITTADYPTPARRPANSRLSTAKLTRDYAITPRPWADAVAEIVDELQPGRRAP